MISKFMHEFILKEYAGGKGVNDSEGMFLAGFAADVPKDGIIVEVGSYRGQSAAYLAAGSKRDVNIYLVDLWDRDHLDLVSDENQYAVAGQSHLRVLLQHFKNMGLAHKITCLQGLSADYAKMWNQGPIDMLFIDGDHSYEGVKLDYEKWSPHVKKGGVIAFHDYSDRWHGVKQLISEIQDELEFIDLVDRVWAGRKW